MCYLAELTSFQNSSQLNVRCILIVCNVISLLYYIYVFLYNYIYICTLESALPDHTSNSENSGMAEINKY